MEKILFFMGICGILLVSVVPIVILAETASSSGVVIINPLKCTNNDNCLMEIIAAITGILQVLAIAVGTIMIIIAGIQYMTSAGSEEKAGKAKKTILYTLIGVAITISVNFIVGIIKEILGGID